MNSVSSDVFTDYSRLSESSKYESSNDGTGFYSNSTIRTQNTLPKEIVLQDRTLENNYKNNTLKMKLPTSIVVDKIHHSSSNFRGPQVEKPFQSAISTSNSTQFPLKAKKILKTVNNTKESIPLDGPPVINAQKNLAQLNNMSISRMKERHRQECRKSGQWTQIPNKAKLQTQNSIHIMSNQRQQVQQRSPITTPHSASIKYQVYTPPVSSRTKCNPLPTQSTVVSSDQNRFKYGSLRSTGPRYSHTQENIPRSHNGLNSYGRTTINQHIELYPQQKHQVGVIYNHSLKHQSTYSKNSCLLQKQSDCDNPQRVSPYIKKKKNQNILKLGEIFDEHMSNNPKVKAEIDRVPHIYNKRYHSVPHSLYLGATEKPKLAHKQMADTLIRRRGHELSEKAASRNSNVDCNKCHNNHCCAKIVDIYPNHRNLLYTRSPTQACPRPSVIHDCYSKRGYIEAPLEPSETCHDRKYNEKKIRSMNIAMMENRYNQDYKNYYRH
ncbi:hypothetical protein K501DRAFT_271682 [Backusella circina FSU 941]|nr:hypothetical protein K501DRAFT_271682 [Backusella circina FSU 941]